MTPHSRRDFLKSALGVAAVTATAGCSALGGTDSQTTTTAADGTPNKSGGGAGSKSTATSTRSPTPTPAPMQLASSHSDFQRAIEALGGGETLLVDDTVTLQDTASLKSNVRIVGGGGKLVAADDMNANLLSPEGVTNVLIHGVEFEGNGQNNGSNRIIGGVSLQQLSHLRITNCTFRNAGINAIELVDKQGGTFDDIYIANNRFLRSNNHAVIMGLKGKNGVLKNVIVEGNTVIDTSEAQGIGIFGQDSSSAKNTAVLGNVVNNVGKSAEHGTNIALEERANNSIVYGNRVLGNSSSKKGGIAVTKNGDNNVIGNNYLSQNDRTLQVRSFDWYEPAGPPRHNLVTRNHVESGLSGFFYDRLEGDLHVSDNRIENVSSVIDDNGTNTGSNYTFYRNGPRVAVAKVGIPDAIGNGVRYTDRNGTLLGKASWKRGGLGTGQRVSVSVSTEV